MPSMIIPIEFTVEKIRIRTARAAHAVMEIDMVTNKAKLPSTPGVIRQLDGTQDGVDVFSFGNTQASINYSGRELFIWNYKMAGVTVGDDGVMTVVVANSVRSTTVVQAYEAIETQLASVSEALGVVTDHIQPRRREHLPLTLVRNSVADIDPKELVLVRGIGLDAHPAH